MASQPNPSSQLATPRAPFSILSHNTHPAASEKTLALYRKPQRDRGPRDDGGRNDAPDLA